MSLIVQFQCLFYSFLFGFVMTGVYHIMNRLLYGVPMFLRYICQCLIGICFGMLYFYGLVFLNEGILRLYFFIFMLMGYLLYSHYYAYYLWSAYKYDFLVVYSLFVDNCICICIHLYAY